MNQNIQQIMSAASEIRWSGMGDTEILDTEKFAVMLIEKCAEICADMDGGENMFSRGIRDYFGVE